MKANVYRIELLVIDTELYGTESVINQIQSDDDLCPEVMCIESAEVEWSDDHPLNNESTTKQAFYELFSDQKAL